MSYPKSVLEREYEQASDIGLRNACKDAEEKYDLPPGLMLAVASRETHMKNITGDGGHGRGVFQIDDRWHQSWLAQHAGPNGIPPVREAAFYAASLLAQNIAQARKAGVPKDDAVAVALAGYNAGMTKAITDYKSSGNPDAHTTDGDYSRDVLARRRDVVTFMPAAKDDDKDKDKDKDKSDGKGSGSNGKTSPTGGAQAPSGPRIVINPHHLRSMANVLDRSEDDFRGFITKLNALKTPTLEHRVDVQLTSELSAINSRLRMLAAPAHEWAVDLRKRATRIDEPAGPGKGKGKHTPVKYRHALQNGSRGAQVRTLQRLLNKFGFGPLEVDGQFGPLTEAALRRFQAKKHLPVNGIAADKTWEALLGHAITIKRPPVSSGGGGGGGGGGGTAPSTGGTTTSGEGREFRKALVAAAHGELGTTAGFKTGQSNPYTKWAGRMAPTYAEHWCADFVSWAWAKAGHPVGNGGKGYSNVDGWMSYFRSTDNWHPKATAGTPPVGAVVCIDWGDGGSGDHVGIVSRVENGTLYYISGNTGEPRGSHIGVYEKSVPVGAVLGYGW